MIAANVIKLVMAVMSVTAMSQQDVLESRVVITGKDVLKCL